MQFRSAAQSVSKSTHNRRLLPLGLAAVLAGILGVTAPLSAAEYEVVGVLAYAVEPDVAKELGLTDNQLTQLRDLINDAEAETLTVLSELNGLSPQERARALADFRVKFEDQGLKLLSTQQRAKLEQVRLKRLGPSFFADPVVARRIGLTADQQQRLAAAVAQRQQGSDDLSEPSAGLEALEENQRRALRSMLLGEIVSPPALGPNTAPTPVAAGEGPPVDESEPPGMADAEAPVAPTPEPVAPGTVPVPAQEPTPSVPPAPAVTAEGPPPVNVPSAEVSPATGEKPPAPTETEAPDQSQTTSSPAEEGQKTAANASESASVPQPEETLAKPDTASPGAMMAEASPAEPAPPPAPSEVPEKPAAEAAPGPGTVSASGAEPATPEPVAEPTGTAAASSPTASPSSDTPAETQETSGSGQNMTTAVQGETGAPASPPAAPGSTGPGVPGPVAPVPPPPPGWPGFVPIPGPGPTPPPAAPTAAAGASPKPSVTAAPPQLPPADVKLRFNFRYQPWKDVLEWLAQQAGLSLVMEAPPPGTFNYVDDHDFTPAQAIDLLNSVLLTKGYVLVRRERMLILLNVEDGVPPNLVDRVTPEDLDKRGDYEMVSCLFQLRRMTPEEAEQEVKKLLGPQGHVIVLSKARQLLVTETAGRLRTIRRMIEAIENPDAENSTVRTFRINPVTVDQVLNIVRQMFQIPADQTATTDGNLRFAVDPSGSRIIVTGTPEMLDRFAQILKALDPSSEGVGSLLESTPQLEVYPITSADPQMILQVLQTLLAGMPDVRLAIDPRTGALVAWARPAQHATIRATLQQMQGEVGQVEVIPLRVVDPQLAVLAINKLFGVGDSAAANAPTVDADLSTRMLLVRGSRTQIDQIKQLLVKMGEPSAEGGAGNVNLMRTIPLDPATAQAVLDQMQALWPQFRGNRLQIIRSVVPAESGSGKPAESSPPAGNQPSSEATRSSADLESQRIPLPISALPARRLVMGSGSKTSASGGTGSSSSTPPANQPAQQPPAPTPQPGGQPPFFGPFGPPGNWGPPGGGPGGGFDRWRGFDRGGWRGRGEGDRGGDWQRSTFLEVPETLGEPMEIRPASPAFEQEVSETPSESARLTARVFRLVSLQSEAGETTGESAATPTAEQQAVAQEAISGASSSATVPPANAGAPAAAQSETPAAGARSPETAPPPVIVALTPEGLVIASQDPEALNQFEDLVRRMVSQGAYPRQDVPELVVYYLKHAKAESVASVLDQILGGGTLTSTGSGGGSLIGEIARAAFGELGGGLVGTLLGADSGSSTTTSSSSTTRTSARVQITPDARLNALIVQAYPQDLQLIEEILRVLDQQDSPQDPAVQPKTIIIPVKNTQAEEIAQILRTVYQDRLVQAGGGANRPPNPQEIIQLLRGARGGPGGGRQQVQEEPQRMSIGVDTRTNSVIISAPEKLLNEVRQLVEQLDQRAVTESEETTQVVTLQKSSPESIRAALSALLGSGVQIRGGTSGGQRSGSTGTTAIGGRTQTNQPSFGGGNFGGFRGVGQTPFGGFGGGFNPGGARGSFGGGQGGGRGR